MIETKLIEINKKSRDSDKNSDDGAHSILKKSDFRQTGIKLSNGKIIEKSEHASEEFNSEERLKELEESVPQNIRDLQIK